MEYKRKTNLFTDSIRYYSLILVFVLFIFNCHGQVSKDFKQRTSISTPLKKNYNIHGDFTIIGNTNLTLENYSPTKDNGYNISKYVDMDSITSTENSSSATLTLSNKNNADQECSYVIYAGLYWAARTNNTVTNLRKREIKIKCPEQTYYQNLIAKETDIQYPGNNNMYVGYVEVTDLVRKYGIGEYWVADIAITAGLNDKTGFYGGWGIIVVYKNPKMLMRNVTVFDGYAYMEGYKTLQYNLPISGFNTIQSGEIKMKLGLMAGEGDVGVSGDYFQIQRNTDTSWLSLHHSRNSPTNFFNSSIETMDNIRNPNLQNNTGIDICMFDIPNNNNSVISNNQTSVNFKYGSTHDTYTIFAIAMSVDAYIPEVEGSNKIKSIEGIPIEYPDAVTPGQHIDFKLEIRNKGTEPIDDVKIIIPIPYNSNYISSSGEVNFTPEPIPNNLYFDSELGANGSIVWDLGYLPLPEYSDSLLASINYTLQVTEDCSILQNSSCNPWLTIDGLISGTGVNSNVSFNNMNFIQGYISNNNCEDLSIDEPIKLPIDATNYISNSCQSSQTKRVIYIKHSGSSIPIESIAGYFPEGSHFYNKYPPENPYIEFTDQNPFPETNDTYYVIPPGDGSCYFEFEIVVYIYSTPTVENISYCVNDQAYKLIANPSSSLYKVFFFTSQTSSEALSEIIPSTATTGIYTYYAAEGLSTENYGPRVPIEVKVNPSPVAFAGLDKSICLGDTIQIGKTSSPGCSYSWTSNPPSFSSAVSDPFVSPTTPTNYTVVETIIETGCTDTATMNSGVHVYPVPISNFLSSLEIAIINKNVKFENQSVDAISYEWDFGDGSQITTQVSPDHIFTELGYHNVSLTAINEIGCTDIKIKQMPVTNDDLYPPNAFSPNSSKEEDREFRIHSPEVSDTDFTLFIFNRWGEIIFETSTQEKGWDGKMKNGNPAPPGIYIWVLQYIDIIGKTRKQQGNVTLLY